MRPAFDSTKQAAAFTLLLLFLLAAPVLAGKRFLPPREQAYASEGWIWGPYSWIQRQIFEETNDIDIAFMGSSHMLWGIDTPYVQQKLDERLARKTVVRSICWSGAGFDTLYFVSKDLLEHRRVKTLVFYAEDDLVHPAPNAEAPHWFRWGDDAGAVSRQPLKDRAIYYFAAMLGMPRNLLELATPNLAEATNGAIPNYYVVHSHSDDPETRLGSVNGRLGYADLLGENTNFIAYMPQTQSTPEDVRLYSPATAANFVFLNGPQSERQAGFARQFGALAKKYGCQLVLLHLPTMTEKASPVMTEIQFWPGLLHTDVAMLGIPAGRLFAGLSEREVEQLFGNPWHLNQNGQEYFTRLITPALLQLYENQAKH